METSTAAVMKRANGAPMSAKDAMGELERALDHYDTVVATIEDEITRTEREASEAVNEYLVPAAAQLNEDIRRLRASALEKDAEIKEWQSKFSFVLGTLTERIEDVPRLGFTDPDAEPVETIARKARR
jgi:hypothetical protein